MDPFADVQDVVSIWRPLSDAEVLVCVAWIDQASQQVRDEVPDVDGLDVDERVAAGSLSPDTVRSVVARMVLRVLRNPEGARQRSQTVDDYSESITVDGSLSSGEMFISAREMSRLIGAKGDSSQAFSVDTAPAQVMFSKPWGLVSSGQVNPWGYAWDQFPP